MVVFLFITCLHYLKRSSKLVFLDWDITNITLGDYSIEYEISNEAYDWFLENIYIPNDKPKDLSPGESLKEYLILEIEAKLNDVLRKKREDDPEGSKGIKINQVKIADIVFAFNNGKLIKLLRKRGMYIANQKYDDMRETEKEITELKNEEYDSLTRPVGAFITFEEEDGYILAQEFEKQYSMTGKVLPTENKLLNQDCFFSEATEPLNILWENRHFTDRERFIRSIQACVLIFFMTLASFVLIYLGKSTSISISNTYDIDDCTSINTAYNTTIEQYAYIEYVKYNAYPDDYVLTGVL